MARYADIEKIEKLLVQGIDENGDSIVSLRDVRKAIAQAENSDVKVGDIVYCFAPCFDTDRHPKLKVVEKEIKELKTIATVFGLNFDINSIGKTVFLTREEAEKALKDRRKENEGK